MVPGTSTSAKLLEDITSCCLCNEPYGTNTKLPKALPCLHTFCGPCLNQLCCRSTHKDNQESMCPKCPVVFSLPPEGAQNLPTNAEVLDMIQKMSELCSLQETDATAKSSTCLKHAGDVLVMVCVTCELGLCKDCLKPLTKGEHHDHELEAVEGYLSRCKLALADLKERSSMLAKTRNSAKKAADEKLRDMKDERDKEIDKQSEEAIHQVKEWQVAEKNKACDVDGISAEYDSIQNHNEQVISDAESLFNPSCAKIPSLQEIEKVRTDLDRCEMDFQALNKREIRKPPVSSIKVITE